MSVTAALVARHLRTLTRMPSAFVPSLVFPAFVTVTFSNVFAAFARVPGFPAERMVDWILPMAVVQGAAFAGVGVGLSIARDIESGFFDRLLLAPQPRWRFVAWTYLAAAVRAFIPFTVVLVIGLASGARLRGGLGGLGTLVLAVLGVAFVAAGWGVGIALRIGSMKAAPVMQVGIFVTVFLSTAQAPIEVMVGWLRQVASLNPMTSVLALGRQGFLGPVTWAATWPGLVAIAVAASLLGVFAARGLRSAVP